jgi:hypothetical protein
MEMKSRAETAAEADGGRLVGLRESKVSESGRRSLGRWFGATTQRHMPAEKALSGGNLGPVLETYGGKSLKRIVTVGVAVFGSGLTAAILIRVSRPDYLGLATVVLGVGLAIALAYVTTNWGAALAKWSVSQIMIRFLGRAPQL